MEIDPKRVPHMDVCRACRDVVGYFHPLNARRPGPLVQRGSCEQHASQSPEPGWTGFDFNRQVDLCYCCGTVPLQTGSRFSVWFCAACKEQVLLLNARHGRCILPIGRHSVHRGSLLPARKLDDPIAVTAFLGDAVAAKEVHDFLSDWRRIAVGRNLDTPAMPDRSAVSIETYCRVVAGSVDPMDRFREMCAYLVEWAAAASARKEERA